MSILLLVCLALCLTGCGSKPPAEGTPEATMVSVPDWYAAPPQDPNYLYATATSMSRDLQLAVEKAKQQARLDLAAQLEVKAEGLTKKFDEEVGLNEESELLSEFSQVSKSLVSTTLNGTRVKNQEIQTEGAIYRAYILMELPLGAYNVALMEKIKANQNMYTRFRATQAFDELEQEIERYEQYKKEQGELR
jgi:hypothetical protein